MIYQSSVSPLPAARGPVLGVNMNRNHYLQSNVFVLGGDVRPKPMLRSFSNYAILSKITKKWYFRPWKPVSGVPTLHFLPPTMPYKVKF